MTCIVGLTDGNHVYLGGDSFSGNSSISDIDTQEKVFRIGEFVLGGSGTWREHQLVRGNGIPKITKSMLHEDYLIKKLAPYLRKLYKDEGCLKTENGNENCHGYWLIGFRGRLFTLQHDFSFTESAYKISAIGSGSDFALGSLLTSQKNRDFNQTKEDKNWQRRILLDSLVTSESFSPYVKRPFLVVSTKDKTPVSMD